MKAWLQRRRARNMLVLFFVLLVAGLIVFFLPAVLTAPAQTQPADVILHYAISQQLETDAYVVQLYQQKLGKKIVCISKPTSCGLYPADDARRHLIELGIPAEDVLVMRLPFVECLGEGLPHVTALAKEQGWQQALVVMRPVFSRFGGRVITKHLRQAGLQTSITYSAEDRQNFSTRWWSDHQKAQMTIDAAINALLDPLYTECR